jgi:outer membrane protein assembly factor BamB
MVQRNDIRKRWKQIAIVSSSVALSLALGIVAAQEAKQAAPAKDQAPPQAPAKPPQKKEAPVKAPVQTVAAGAIFQGGVQFQVAPRVVLGQLGGPAQGEGNSSSERVKLPVDPRARRKIDDAKRFIELKDWQSAAQILQMLLDANEDNFLQESESDKGRRVSVRAEANRLLGSLPREGKQFYEQQFGAQAKLALKQAKANGNPQALAEVALKYVHTDAGAEAAALLGSYHLDHGRYIVAALCYDRLMSRDDNLANLSASTLLKAAFAFERAGDTANRDRAWSAFQAKQRQGTEKLPSAIRSWDDEKLKATLGKRADARNDQARSEWTLFMGSPDRTAHSLGTDPFLEPMFPPYEPVPPGPARKEVDEASRKLTNLGFPVIPGSHPLVVRDLVIFRALDGIHAFNVKTGQMEWNSTSDAGLAQMIRSQSSGDPESITNIYRYRDTAPNMVTENTLLGTLSADQELVYAVEDMAIPPVTSNYGNPFGGFNPRSMPRLGDKLSDFMSCNHLTAFDIDGGRAVWSIGTRDPDQPFTDMFFLGPPLPLGEKLYVLGESNAEIKLLCLQTRRTPKPGNANDYQFSVELVWSQPLGVVDRRITEDPVRRTEAAALSYSDGILICPTNAGSIVGVDLLTRSLVWAYSYQSEVNNVDAENMIFPGGGRARVFRGGGIVTEPMFGSIQWSFSAPVISAGKVLLAPPDGKALHAINLRDGSLAWSVNRVDNAKDASISDNYLAGVFDGKVILAGKASIRALDLSTGKQLWRTAISMPIGRGTANERSYFIPVRGNEIWVVSLSDGHIIGKSKALHKEQLGNLVLAGDELISLTPSALLVYPQQAVKERQVAQRLKANPTDPIGLLERGELRWHKGDHENAVDDFRASLANKPAPATKEAAQTKLFDADCDLLEADFNGHEKLLAECDRLLADSSSTTNENGGPGSSLDRRSRLLCITAKGRERQGRILDALQCYQDYAKLDSKLIPSPEDPQTKILPSVWARAQAQSLAARANASQKDQLQAHLRTLWQQTEKESNESDRLSAMIQFADFYGDITAIGQEASLAVAEKLVLAKDFTPAQLRLLPLLESREPNIAAKATEALARINRQMGEMENAVYYLRILAKRYPNVIIRDGKTGLQLFQEIATDKRFLPYLDEQRGLAGLGEFTIDKDVAHHGGVSNFGFKIELTPPGPLPPSLSRFMLQIQSANNNNTSYYYTVTDQSQELGSGQAAGSKPWMRETLSVPTLLPYTYQGAGLQGLASHYQVCGQAFVFAWGNQVVAIDPVQKKQLWTIDVLGDDDPTSNQNSATLTSRRFSSAMPAHIMPHPQLSGRFQLYWSSGKVETLGTLGPGSTHCITATMKDVGLVGLDPQTGKALWTRSDVSPEAQLFGDSEYVIALSAQHGQRPVAFRISDGHQTVLSNELEALYKNKVAQHGRYLLVKMLVDGFIYLSLIDPLSPNAPIWMKKNLDRDSIFLPFASPSNPGVENDEMVGCLAPSGDLQLFDLVSGNTLGQVHLNLKFDLKSFKQGQLLADQDHYYVFLCEGTEQKDQSGLSRQLFPQYQGLRGIIINGPAFAIDRKTKAVLWQETMPLNYLLTQRFGELPVLLCATTVMESRQPVPRPAGLPANAAPALAMAAANGRLQSEVKLFAKQTGKPLPLEFKNSDFERFNRNGGMQGIGFRDLIVERARGRVELLSSSQRFAFRITPHIAGINGEETANGAKGD